MHHRFAAGLALAAALPWPAHAQVTREEIQQLHQEIGALRASYESRLRALEQRLQAAEASATPPSTVTAALPAAPPAPANAVAGAANAFNPAIALILSGLYTDTSRDPAGYTIGGFALPPVSEAGPGTRGFSLAESELSLAASIDPWLQGAANIALHPDDSVSVEEAYVQTTSLGHGLTLRAGRFFSGIGYLNAQHAHTWDFVDNPLAYQAMLGTQYGDDGVQLRLLAPTDLFLELGAELGRGRSFPGGDDSRNGAGMAALTAHAGGDIGDSQSWRAGLSVLGAKAADQALQLQGADGSTLDGRFAGRTRMWVADAVWKWAPGGNATRTSVKLQGEFLQSRRTGTLTPEAVSSAAYRAVQSGWYVQGVYQFLPAWRVGLRTERLDPGSPDYGANAGLYALADHRPDKQSVMVDFNPSEFSRVRLQLARDRSRPGPADNQLFLQYQMSLGAHGAHSY